MNYIGISKNSKRFKGNLHSHTTHSDGMLTPTEAKEHYKSNGYSFLAITDHETYSDFRSELNDEDFIIIPGIEVSTNLAATSGDMAGHRFKVHHILAYLGTSEMQAAATKKVYSHLESKAPKIALDEWDGLAAAQEVIDELHAMGFAIAYAHPLWSRVDFEEFASLKNIFALEFYNYGSDIECALGNSSVYWDAMLAKNRRVLGIATDDNHNTEKMPDSFGGAIVVCAETLSHDDIMANMLKGNYYSTSGVDIIEWGIEGNEVYVTCSDVNRINFIVGGKIADGETIYCQNIEDTIHSARYTLKGSERYVRIECVDKYGRKAWTNPYFLK